MPALQDTQGPCYTELQTAGRHAADPLSAVALERRAAAALDSLSTRQHNP